MEVNQEGNKDKKEIHHGQDDDATRREVDRFLEDPLILHSVLSTSIITKQLEEIHQGGHDSSKTPIIQKEEIDQGPPCIYDPNRSVSTPIKYPIIASTTATPPSISVSDDGGEDDKRWSIEAELANLFNEVLKSCYPQLEDENCTVLPCTEEGFDFDYICENVLTIWPKLRGNDRGGGPRSVGTKIMERIRLMRPEMLEQELVLHDVGFVLIKLSGLWMAKSVHKMLKDGIDTWAPEFLMENVRVKFLPDNTDLMCIDVLRHELITRTLINMLEYSKIPVKFLMPPDEHPIEERDGVLIFRNAAEELEIHVKRDGCCGDLVNDLTELWYGLEKGLADWIIWVAPVHQQEYIKSCIKAAQSAKWLPPHWSDSPRANFAGYQIYNSELKHEPLDDLLSNAEVICAEAAADLGYTGEQVSNCALKYTILKNDRLADYTFSYQEMLHAEGNTFVYLLNTRNRIRLFTKDSCEAINELTKASGLELVEEDDIWKGGVERVLLQHLLRFTKVIEDSCLPVLPHILCEFLYDLSKNFNRFCDESSVFEVGSVAEKTKLLLCEATRLVMDKSFQLLGITPESSSLPEGSPQMSSSLLLTERLNHMDPPKINTRFELFSIKPHITSDPTFKTGKMFGQICICDTYNILSDWWGPTSVPDHGFVSLFDVDWPVSMDISNHALVDLPNPCSPKLVPFSSCMEVRVELYASSKESDTLFELCDCLFELDCEEFLEKEDDAECCMSSSQGNDGLVRMYYILLKNAIDSKIEVTYCPDGEGGGELCGEIFARYGNEILGEDMDPAEKDYYTATLFKNRFDRQIREIPLDRSRLAVPRKGSIVVVARLWKEDCKILDDCLVFTPPSDSTPCEDRFEQKMSGYGGTLNVRVDWRRG